MALNDVILAAARATLANAGVTTTSTNTNYILRLARNVRKQEAAGVPVSREAARGHRVTPEHPNRKRPALPARASAYPHDPKRGSKYESRTQPIAGLGTAPAPKPPTQRRLRHDRAGEVTRGQRRVGFAGSLNESIVDSYTDRRFAKRRIREIVASDPYGRIMLDVYDCSKARGQRWTRVFENRGHSPGITAHQLLEMMEEREYTLEEIAVANAGAGDYPTRGARISHVCIFNIYYFPSADLKRATDRRRRADGTLRRGPRT